MRPVYPKFTADELSARIDEYFNYIKGKYRNIRIPVKNGPTKTVVKEICDRKAEAATKSGLAMFLGFNSLDDFDRYLLKGRFARILNRAQLRILAIYEQKLHEHYTGGPIFAIKYLLGLNENKNTGPERSTTVNVKIIGSGPALAASEKEVMLEAQHKPKTLVAHDQ